MGPSEGRLLGRQGTVGAGAVNLEEQGEASATQGLTQTLAERKDCGRGKRAMPP